MNDSTAKLLHKPLDVIQDLFNSQRKANHKGDWFRQNWGVESLFATFVNEHFDQVSASFMLNF